MRWGNNATVCEALPFTTYVSSSSRVFIARWLIVSYRPCLLIACMGFFSWPQITRSLLAAFRICFIYRRRQACFCTFGCVRKASKCRIVNAPPTATTISLLCVAGLARGMNVVWVSCSIHKRSNDRKGCEVGGGAGKCMLTLVLSNEKPIELLFYGVIKRKENRRQSLFKYLHRASFRKSDRLRTCYLFLYCFYWTYFSTKCIFTHNSLPVTYFHILP